MKMIRIFNSNDGDPMILLTSNGLKEFMKKVNDFIESDNSSILFTTETFGTPSPYDEFLNGLKITKCKGDSSLMLNDDNWLDLSVKKEEIKEVNLNLSFLNDGDHEHLYSNPMSLIIEVDESWPGW